MMQAALKNLNLRTAAISLVLLAPVMARVVYG